MALPKVSTAGTGRAGYRGSRWCARKIAKESARKRRRREDRQRVREQRA